MEFIGQLKQLFSCTGTLRYERVRDGCLLSSGGSVENNCCPLVVSGHLRPSSLHHLSDDMLVVPEVSMGLSGDMPKVTMVAPRASTS